jgi:hypothetical protein
MAIKVQAALEQEAMRAFLPGPSNEDINYPACTTHWKRRHRLACMSEGLRQTTAGMAPGMTGEYDSPAT